MRVLIRADGDSEIGTGHIMRMLALSQWIIDAGGAVSLAATRLSDALTERLCASRVSVLRGEAAAGSSMDIAWTRELMRSGEFDWLISDGYSFTDGFQSAIFDDGILHMVVDDYGHCDRYVAQLVLNQNYSADKRLYARRGAQTRLLLGTAYTILRREFVSASLNLEDVPDRANNILVTMGGADPVNATATVIELLQQIPDSAMRITVVVGPSNPRADALQEGCSDSRFEWVRSSSNMRELMEWAEIAVAGAGTTTWELAYMGVPTLLVVLADNQEEIASSMMADGICVSLGWYHDIDTVSAARVVDDLRMRPDVRRRMSGFAHDRVDGQGGRRVVEAMQARMEESR